ncbi:MAG: hypothetical protein U0354_06185 [Candidatus Sericytochromatia bacterium]
MNTSKIILSSVNKLCATTFLTSYQTQNILTIQLKDTAISTNKN